MFKILKNNEYRRLFENFFSLSVLNVTNYIFPLILIPYLTRVLGVDKYGIYVFAFAIINYFTLLVRYGFDFSATKQVAIHRDDGSTLNIIFSSVLFVRMVLSIISVLLIFILIEIIPKLQENPQVYISGIGIFIGIALSPTWLFQGMERMKYITIVNIFVRLTATILIFIFVRSENDYARVLLFHSFGYLSGGILSLYLSFRIFNLDFKMPTFTHIKNQFKDGWYIFISTIGMNFYRESNIVILGFICNFQIVGYYAAAEKLIKVIQSITVPFVNTIYPYFGRKLNATDSTAQFSTFNKIGWYYVLTLSLISVIAFSGASLIPAILGQDYSHSILSFKILSFVIIFGGLNYYFGMIGLVNIGKEKHFSLYVWVCGVLNLGLSIFLSYKLKDVGAAMSMVIIEFLISILILNSIRKYKSLL